MREKLKTERKQRVLGIAFSALLASPVGLSFPNASAETPERAGIERTEGETWHGADRAVLNLLGDQTIQVDGRSSASGNELGGASFRMNTDSGPTQYIVSAHRDPDSNEIETAIQRCDADMAEIREHGVCGPNQRDFVAVRMGRNGILELGASRVWDEDGTPTLVFFTPTDPEWDAEYWTTTLREMGNDIERYIENQRRPAT